LDEIRPSVQYFGRTVLHTVGRGGLNNCPVVLAAAPVLIPAGGTVLLLRRLHPQGPLGLDGRQRRPGDAYPRRLPPAVTTEFASPVRALRRRRLVHGGGRSALATDRPTAAVGKPC